MATYTDDFNTTDSTTVGAQLTWTDVAGNLQNLGNVARSSDTTLDESRAEHDTDGVDHYATALISVGQPTSSSSSSGICVRYQNAANTFYCVDLTRSSAGTALIRILKVVAGSATVADSTTVTFTNGSAVLRAEAIGDTITAHLDGNQELSFTDTSSPITTGTKAGIRLRPATSATRTTTYVDNFEFGDLTPDVVFIEGGLSGDSTLEASLELSEESSTSAYYISGWGFGYYGQVYAGQSILPLSSNPVLSSALEGDSSLAGDFVLTSFVEADISGDGSLSLDGVDATLNITTLVGESSISVDYLVDVSLGAGLSGDANLLGTITATVGALTANVAGDSSLSFDFDQVHILSSGVAGDSTLSVTDMEESNYLSIALSGDGTLYAGVLETILAVSIEGDSDLDFWIYWRKPSQTWMGGTIEDGEFSAASQDTSAPLGTGSVDKGEYEVAETTSRGSWTKP